MPEYPRKDGGKVNTDYRGRDAHMADDNTVFSSDDPFGDDHPAGVYGREDGGVVDTRYRDGNAHMAGDNTVFFDPDDD